VTLRPEQLQEAFSSKILHLILFPTERCNFRCTYCYEDFRAGRMGQDVIAGVKALTASRAPDLQVLQISWFGGEPLIEKRVIRELSEHFTTLAEQHGGLTYEANITTNGHLLDLETAEMLIGLGVGYYQISLDGSPDIHDSTRVKKNGGGTFWEIWSNLRALKTTDLEFQVMLRVHYTNETYVLLDSLIKMINDEFGDDSRFPVYFKSVDRLGGPHDADLAVVPEDAKSDVDRLLQSKLRRPAQIFVLSPEEEYVCYASRPNSLAIRANGDIGKCTVALYDERNRIGRLSADGAIDLDQDKLRLWMHGFETLDPASLACPYATMDGAFVEHRGNFDTSTMRKLPVLTSR